MLSLSYCYVKAYAVIITGKLWNILSLSDCTLHDILSSALRDYGICRVFLLLHCGKILSYTFVDNGICANNTSSH